MVDVVSRYTIGLVIIGVLYFSDGIVRVFTRSADRTASPDALSAFEQQVCSSQIPTQVGDINVSDLPEPEILLAPGNLPIYL